MCSCDPERIHREGHREVRLQQEALRAVLAQAFRRPTLFWRGDAAHERGEIAGLEDDLRRILV